MKKNTVPESDSTSAKYATLNTTPSGALATVILRDTGESRSLSLPDPAADGQPVHNITISFSDGKLRLRSTLRGHFEGVWAVAFSPDGKLLTSFSHDTTVRLWDVARGVEPLCCFIPRNL